MTFSLRLLAFALSALLAGFAGSGRCAETVVCERPVEAFDPADSSRRIGRFDPATTLEIEGSTEERRMLRVLWRAPDGRQVRALCRAADLMIEGEMPEKAREAAPSGGRGPDEAPALKALREFDPAIWETTSTDFKKAHSEYGFQAEASEDSHTMRSVWPLIFMKHRVMETIARFQNDRLREASLLFFGRGDAGREMEEKEFQDTLRELEEALDRWVGARGFDAWVPVSATDTKRKSWFKAPLRLDLEWCVTRGAREARVYLETRRIPFRTEFIRLVARPFDGKGDPAQLVKPNWQGRGVTAARRGEIKDRVKRAEGGDVLLEGIPMVDQGQKGYCVCATAERVMRYYGIEVDQNELAKAAGALTAGGTDPAAMAKALRRLGDRFSLGVTELISFDFRKFQNEVRAYNLAARKNKLPEIRLEGRVIVIQQVYEEMDPATLLDVRLKKMNDRTQFLNHVRTHVNQGAPLLWSVQLGLVPEKPTLPQASGGHMRLILGYNDQTGEILYSDSWGVGHEFKRMSFDQAFGITSGLCAALPGS
ncbi:MAG: C39 family peptidase [Verrucomicrobiae bacterium]|nr:C39 family peptidase [Verrucomicrobiae bacterium]